MDLKLLIPGSLSDFYNIHPLFVHAPLALLPSALLLFGAALWRKRPAWITAAKACVYLGALGAVLAVLTGWFAEDSIPHNATIHGMMETHKAAAITVMILALALAGVSFKLPLESKSQRQFFLGMLLITNLLLVAVGDLGARMVYLEGAGVKPAAAVIAEPGEATPHRHDGVGSEEEHHAAPHNH